jgi:hypothetical protein
LLSLENVDATANGVSRETEMHACRHRMSASFLSDVGLIAGDGHALVPAEQLSRVPVVVP